MDHLSFGGDFRPLVASWDTFLSLKLFFVARKRIAVRFMGLIGQKSVVSLPLAEVTTASEFLQKRAGMRDEKCMKTRVKRKRKA